MPNFQPCCPTSRSPAPTTTSPLLRPLVEKTTSALSKVYAQRQVRFELAIASDLALRADAGDLYELLGNLLDNAAKYGSHWVRISAQRTGNQLVNLVVEDDGSGFPEDAAKLMQRGVRADTRQEGQGIGLASVADIVEAYGGTLSLGHTAGGGARVQVSLSA